MRRPALRLRAHPLRRVRSRPSIACFRGIRGRVGEFFDLELWIQWFAQLDRSFLFLLILPFIKG